MDHYSMARMISFVYFTALCPGKRLRIHRRDPHQHCCSMLARPIENIDIDGISSGMELLMALQSIRKQIRKLGRHDQAQSQDEGGDSKALKSRLDHLESFSPMRRISEISEAFFPLYISTANTPPVDSIHPLKGLSFTFLQIRS